MFKICSTCKGTMIPQGLMEFKIRKCPNCEQGFVDEYEEKKEDTELILRDKEE